MFKKNNQTQKELIALDLNKNYISVSEILNKGKEKRVENFNVVDCPSGIFTGDNITNLEHLILVIEKLISNIKFSSKNKETIFSIPEDLSIKQIFSVDKRMSDDEIENYIVANYEKYITQLEYSEVYLDFTKIGINKKDPNKKDMLLVVAKKDLIDKLEDAITSAGLTPVSIDINGYALERMIKYYKDNDEEILAYFHIQKDKTSIHYFKNAKGIYDTESEDFSLNYLNNESSSEDKEEVVEEDNVDEIKNSVEKDAQDEDEDIELDLDAFEVPNQDEDVQGEVEEDVIEKEKEEKEQKKVVEEENVEVELNSEQKIINQRNQDFYDFIESNLNMFYAFNDDIGKINKIVLSGDVSQFKIDVKSLSEDLNTKLITAQPFAKMKLSKNVNDEKLLKYAPNLGILVGLSMPKTNDDIDINLHDWRSEVKQAQNKKFNNTLAVYVMICLGFLGYKHFDISKKIESQNARNNAVQTAINTDLEMENQIEVLKKEKEFMVERINTINSLQVERPKIVHIFSDIVQAVPKEIFLTRFNRMDNNRISIQGVAFQDKKVFDLIKNLENSNWLFDVKISRMNSIDDEGSSKDYQDSVKYEFEIEMKEEDMSKVRSLTE